MVTDIFTKPLSGPKFIKFRNEQKLTENRNVVVERSLCSRGGVLEVPCIHKYTLPKFHQVAVVKQLMVSLSFTESRALKCESKVKTDYSNYS